MVRERGSVRFNSPGFPAAYAPSSVCTWVFTKAFEDHLKVKNMALQNSGLTFFYLQFTAQYFELEHSARCTYDYVSVNGSRFCGTRGPLSFIDSSPEPVINIALL